MKCSKCGCDSDHDEIEKLQEENRKLRYKYINAMKDARLQTKELLMKLDLLMEKIKRA